MRGRRLWTLLRRLLLLRAQEDRDLDDELAFHLAEETRLRLERGASPEDAARGARLAFGSVTLAKETTRGVWVSGAMERLLQDLRFGFRILTNAPVLLLSAATLVALVIGGNTTVYSIAHAILSKPAPGVRADNLVTVSWVRDDGFVEPETTYANYLDLAAGSRSLGPMLAYQSVRVALSHENGTHGLWAAAVSTNYFQTLEVPLSMGRSFTADENGIAASGLVVVISDRAWREYFSAAPSVIGAAVIVNGVPATIIGVAAPDFRGTYLAPSVDAWVPVVPYARAVGGQAALTGRGTEEGLPFIGNVLGIHAQLQSHASLTQARAELTALWERLQAQYAHVPRNRSVTIVPYSGTAGGNSAFATQGTTFLAVFSVITALTLMIVCANVANLLLGRAAVRQRELALRQSLGASRTRIVRMLLAEGLVIALLAGVAAFVFARWMSGIVADLVAPMVPPAVAQVITVPDWTVAAYALTLALGSMAFFTLAPAARAWRQPLLPWLKAGEQGVVQGRSRLSSGLVVLQLALAVLLITSAGLASRSITLFAGTDLGFDSGSILLATVNTGGGAVDPPASVALLERLRTRLQAVPGVEHVSHSWGTARESVRSEPLQIGDGKLVVAETKFVGPDYLRVYGVTPLSGRELGVETDRAVTPAVVTQQLADRLWPGQPAIGRRLFFAGPRGREGEVVGVAPDLLYSGNRPAGNLYVLLPASQDQRSPGERTLYLRYRGRLEVVAPAIGRAIRAEDPRVPLVSLRTFDAQLDTDIWPVRALTTLLTLFAVVSLIVAIIGQYAVVAFDVRRRIREFGVRIALGASSRQILAAVLQEGLRLTALGLAIGFGLSVLTGTGLSRVLYGITPTDPLTYGTVLLLLSIVSIAACSLPAVRASRVNPISTLRQD
jgi:predicted permease